MIRLFTRLLPMVLAIANAAVATDSKPNIVVILTDDQGWGDLSVNGNRNLETPNIDSLARDGASFERFFVCPVCSPTRAEFLTGRYHARSGVYSTSAGGERMNLDETTIADVFKAAGYATGAFGKWHNGMQYPYHPNGRGFDEFYGFCSGHWGHYFDPMLEYNGEIVQGVGYVINDFTDRVMAFIEENRDRPFFAYLPYNTPHSPMQVPDEWWETFENKELAERHRDPKKENLSHTRAALAMCENIDWNVGRLLKKLDELEIAENTVVLYFCDNGPNGWRWNGGMKGRKGATDEGGVRSPLLVRWPGKIEAGRSVSQIGSAIDLLPTLADMAGVEPTVEKPLDGISLAPLLTGNPDAIRWKDRKLIHQWKNKLSIRNQQYRLDHQGNLFDISSDPRQERNIAKQQPELLAELQATAEAWRKEIAGYDDDNRPFVIGHPDFPNTQIPARDGVAHGNIERSNKFPNCSFFRNWTSIDDRITWDVEVAEAGEFEVEIYYTCPERDLGSTVALSCGEHRVTAKISEAHDPPLKGAAEDRGDPRMESYVKDFRPMDFGTIRLDKGKGLLTLKALEMPGTQVMEFRLMMLRRVGG